MIHKSVSGLLKERFPFDAKKHAEEKAEKRGCEIKEIYEEWNEAAKIGTKFHHDAATSQLAATHPLVEWLDGFFNVAHECDYEKTIEIDGEWVRVHGTVDIVYVPERHCQTLGIGEIKTGNVTGVPLERAKEQVRLYSRIASRPVSEAWIISTGYDRNHFELIEVELK